jgi:hypothetical protein
MRPWKQRRGERGGEIVGKAGDVRYPDDVRAHSRDLPIVNVRAVAFRYDRFTSIRDIKSVATTFGLVESGPSSSRSEGTKRRFAPLGTRLRRIELA